MPPTVIPSRLSEVTKTGSQRAKTTLTRHAVPYSDKLG
jgi:hypothetical protein